MGELQSRIVKGWRGIVGSRVVGAADDFTHWTGKLVDKGTIITYNRFHLYESKLKLRAFNR